MRLSSVCAVAAIFSAAIPAIAAAGFEPASALLRAAPAASAYPNADTCWLRCEETVTLHADGTFEETHHNTARLFNERGLENADVSIPYTLTSQVVTDIHARTVRPDGTVLPVLPADIHQTSPYSDFTLYDDARNVGFSLPGVEDNALIDYRYTVRTRVPLQKGRFADSWWLAADAPCRLNRYTLIAPASLLVHFRAHNDAGVRFRRSLSADGRLQILCWEKRDSPDMMPEPDMPPQETYAPWVEVSTWPSWQSVARWYQTLAGPRMTATPELTALVQRITAGKTTQQAKAQAIFYWVEKKTRYVAIEMGLSAYQPHAAAEVCRNRYGDCKDMATLLAAMFHAAGIPAAWPALLDTESKLAVRDHLATPTAFDHAILRANLDGKTFWFDATTQFCAFGGIPTADQGLDALVVRGGVSSFETIPQGGPEANRTVCRKTVSLHADGSAECRTTVQDDGDHALATREELGTLQPNQLREHFEGLIGGQTEATLLKFSLHGDADPGSPMTYGVRYTAPLWAIHTGSLLIVSDTFSFTPPSEMRRRQYPLYLADAQEDDYTVTIQIPSGYSVESLPDNLREETAAGTLAVTYAPGLGMVTIHKTITQVPATVAPADFPRLRAAYDRFAEHLKEPIILRASSVQSNIP